MNNIVVVIQPGEADDEGPMFTPAIMASPKRGPLSMRQIIPSSWQGIAQRRFVPAYELMPHNPEWELELIKSGISHLALLTGDCNQADPFYFGQGDLVNGMSVMCWYGERTNTYHFFHCEKCAEIALTWVCTQQEKWSADSSSQKETRTLH